MKDIIKKLLKENTTPFIIFEEENKYEKILGICANNQLTEGLISTYPVRFFIQRLENLGFSVKYSNYIIYALAKPDLHENNKNKIEELLVYINTCGYYVSNFKVLIKDNSYKQYNKLSEIKDFSGINDLWFIIESKFDTEFESDDIDYVYHLTEEDYLNKIKNIGLIPKSKSKKVYHPDRLYVVKNKIFLTDLLKQFKLTNKEKKEKEENKEINYTILKIDYKKAGSPKLYNDPNYLNFGYYILDNIPPSAIEVLGLDYLEK